jgi:hypothetical protein
VNYVLIKANNEPGEFTFADSSGYFEIQLAEGVTISMQSGYFTRMPSSIPFRWKTDYLQKLIST